MDRIYLIDDDKSITAILKMIIIERELGEICGISQDPEEALEDIHFEHPDIVIVDLLMPKIDGVSFVRKARQILPEAGFIMLSQVSSKDMIAQAYEAGCDFFIQKPINSVEVENVVRSVSEKRLLLSTMGKMRSIFKDSPVNTQSQNIAVASSDNTSPEQQIKEMLDEIGILGNKGYTDIVNVVSYAVEHPKELDNTSVKKLCAKFTDNPKTMEQRMRRAAQNGLNNLANIGLEDYGNLTFEDFAFSLYQVEQVRREMDFIRGKSKRHGVVKLKKFITGLAEKCRID